MGNTDQDQDQNLSKTPDRGGQATESPRPALETLNRSLMALRLEADQGIVNDVSRNAYAAAAEAARHAAGETPNGQSGQSPTLRWLIAEEFVAHTRVKHNLFKSSHPKRRKEIDMAFQDGMMAAFQLVLNMLEERGESCLA